MLLGPAALAAAIVAGARAVYPRWCEARAARDRPLGADGIVRGAGTIDVPRPGAPGVLLLHGGGDTPQVLALLAQGLSERGFAVRAPLLLGHGRALSALRDVSAEAWHDQVRHEYQDLRRRHEWVGVIGLSMGGALAIHLAAERPDIPALVLLAPYVETPPVVRLASIAAPVLSLVLPYVSTGGRRSVHDPGAAAAGLGHGMLTPAALRALALTADDSQKALPAVTCPTLYIQSREDNRITQKAAQQAFERLGAPEKRLVWVEGAGHVITVDFGHERVTALAAQWLSEHGATAQRVRESVLP